MSLGYLVRFLASGLVAHMQSGPLPTACAIFQMVSMERGYSSEVDDHLKKAGVASAVAHLVRNPSSTVQKVALEAIRHACDLNCDTLEIGSTDVIPEVITIAQSGCDANKHAAVEALLWMADHNAEKVEPAIPVIVELLDHPQACIKDSAASGLWYVMLAPDSKTGGDAYAKIACECGCIPPLLAELTTRCSKSTTSRQNLECVKPFIVSYHGT